MVKKCSFAVLAFILLLLIRPFDATYAGGTTVQVAPLTSMVGEGKTFAVDVTVAGVTDLAVWEFRLFYLNSVLNCTGAVKGSFLESGGGTQFFTFTIYNAYNATHGCLLFGASLIGAVPGVNGSGTLATITFQAKAAGDTSLHFDDDPTWNFLKDSTPPPRHLIPYTTIDGTVHVQNFTLTVFTVGNGSVDLNDTGPYYYFDESVQLTATPAVGWSFDHWSGNLIGSVTPATLIVTGNMSVTATFIQNQYTLGVTIYGSGAVSKNPDQATYPYGSNVTLNASASLGWTFAVWGGDASGVVNPVTVNMTHNKIVTATFTQNAYTLSLSVVGNGSVICNNTGPYNYGNVVLLNATPITGWIFDHWSGDLAGPINPTTLIITANMSVTATFAQINYTLAITIGYGNGHVALNNTGPYHLGDAVLMTAVPDAHWIFNYWSGNLVGSVSPATLVITGNMNVVAWFAQYAYTLTVNIFGSGYVTRNSSGPYYYGDVVQLNGIANTGWSFLCWSEDLSGSTNPTTIFIDGNKVVNANFTWNPYTLTVNVIGNGSVTLSPNATYYSYGDIVLLTAVPAISWSFSFWSGDLTGSANPRTLNMTRNMTVTATFAPANYSLYVGVIGLGSVTLNKTAPYHYGDVVLLIASPNNGWGFDDWTGDLNGSANPATLVITKNMSVAAWFVKNVYTLTVNIVGPGNVTLNKTGPYNFGDAVLLTAVFTPPASFDYWSGGLSGSINPTTLIITTNTSVTAYFAAKPTLTMNPANATCRVYGEIFATTIVVSGAVNVEDCTFEVHFNTTLLDYLGVVWNAWGIGTISVNESTGVITGSTSGSPLNGTQNLITIEFKAACYHIWKNTLDWTNNLSDRIFFQWVNLSYPSGPDLRYEKGGLNQINVGPDFEYTFSPIQGDVDNDGTVNIFDLRTVGAFFGTAEGDPAWTQCSKYDLNGDGKITELDLELVAANFGYVYTH